MTREAGCVECPKNTYSKEGAMSCTPCPDNKLSPAGNGEKSSCFSSGWFLESCKMHCKAKLFSPLARLIEIITCQFKAKFIKSGILQVTQYQFKQ